MRPKILFFDILGSVVDWRGSIAAEVAGFFARHRISGIDAVVFADDWVGRYDDAIEPVRAGTRGFVTLDIVNRETLEASLAVHGLSAAAFPPDALADLNAGWRRLKPWPDAVEGIARLKRDFIAAPLSDGNTRLLVDIPRLSGITFDTIFGADVTRGYKPMPEVYRGACALLGVAPAEAMLVAAHAYDLAAARACGLATAYIARDRAAADPSKAPDPDAAKGWDMVADSLTDLADQFARQG